MRLHFLILWEFFKKRTDKSKAVELFTEFCALGHIVTEDGACGVYPCFGNVTAAEFLAKTGCRD
jgi:hypothetical protein